MAKRHTSSQHTGVIRFSVYRSNDAIEAIYIGIRDNKIAKSQQIGPNGEAIVDLDSRGQVVGIEMLEPGQLSVREFHKITREYKIEELSGLNIDRLQEAFA